MSFTTAISGINAQSEKLNSAGNNIANSQTVGYKSSSVRFADVFAASRGIGVSVSDVRQNFSQGSIESTNRNLDLAIAGGGFYRLEQSSGEIGYSRNGEFSLAANGDIVNAQGAKLMGYGLDEEIKEDTADQAAFPFSNVLQGATKPLNVPANDMPAKATSEASAILNLDATVAAGQDLSSVEIDRPEAVPGEPRPRGTMLNYHFANNFTAYDSLGNPINVATYYERGAGNQWIVTAVTEGQSRGQFTLDFDTNGKILTNAEGYVTGIGPSAGSDTIPGLTPAEDPVTGETTVNLPVPGGTLANALDIQLKFDGSTQFAGTSLQKELTQNGYAKGDLVGIEVLADGTVMRNFSNERSAAAGQIVLASFSNEEGLKPLGNNLWGATNTSGIANMGPPGVGQYGQIQAGAVEASNVELAKELVDMIVAQRAYQANSNTISTQDELMQTIINL